MMESGFCEKCSDDASGLEPDVEQISDQVIDKQCTWLYEEVEQAIQKVVEQSITQLNKFLDKEIDRVVGMAIEQSIMKKSQQWLNDAKQFIERTFLDWKAGTRVVPPLSDDHVRMRSSVVSCLCKLEKDGESMCIVYGRDMKQLMQTRFSGGLYESITEIERDDHDIVIIDRRRGLFFIRVCRSRNNEKPELGNPDFHAVHQKYDRAKRDFDGLKALMREIGMDSNQVKKCFLFHFPIIAFPDLQKKEKPPQNALVLYEEDCTSHAAFEIWWEQRILGPLHSKKFNLEPHSHQTLLAV